MPFPEKRHLFGRLLNQIPWRSSRLQPTQHLSRAVKHSVALPCTNNRIPILSTSLAGSRFTIRITSCLAAPSFPSMPASCNAAEHALAANRPVQDRQVTKPPYDSRCDKGKPADRLEPPCRRALSAIAMRDMSTNTVQLCQRQQSCLAALLFLAHSSPDVTISSKCSD